MDPLIEYYTPTTFFLDYLGWDPKLVPTNQQLLTISEQRLLGATSGRIFHDDLGLNDIRGKIAYYPHDVWFWMMASQWKMLAEEEPFTERCGFARDDLGSRIVAARQVQRIMRLSFLFENRYAPYSKWLGTAFMQLSVAPEFMTFFDRILNTTDWKARDENLGKCYTILTKNHNSLSVTEFLPVETTSFFNRPFHVIFGERFTTAILKAIRDPWLKTLPPVGSVSQLIDSVTISDDVSLSKKLEILYKQNV